MNSMHNSENEIAQNIKEIGSQFIKNYYPDEEDIYPIVWDKIWESRPNLDQEKDVHIEPIRGGLPFAAEGTISLVSPYVILILDSVFHEMSVSGLAPDISEINVVIQHAATTFGAPLALANKMVERLGPKLNARFSEFQIENILSETDTNKSSNRVFVKRVVDGTPRKSGWCGHRVISNNRKNPRYDIIVDEIRGDVLIRKYRNTKKDDEIINLWIDEIDQQAAGLLWLALENFGNYVTFKELRSLLALDTQTPNSIYRPKTLLAELLGEDLRDALIGLPKNNRYPIGRGTVNFCWMRKSDQGSDLCERATRPSDK